MEKRLSATCRTASFALAGYCEARANGRTYLRHRERHTARRPGPQENRHRKAYRPKAFSTICETVHGTRANELRQGIPDGGIRTETQYGVRPGIRGFGRPDGARCPSLSINLGYRGGERERRANSKQEVVRQVRFLRFTPVRTISDRGDFHYWRLVGRPLPIRTAFGSGSSAAGRNSPFGQSLLPSLPNDSATSSPRSAGPSSPKAAEAPSVSAPWAPHRPECRCGRSARDPRPRRWAPD